LAPIFHYFASRMKRKLRKQFNKKSLIHTVRSCFEQIADPKISRGFTLVDYLMSGFAVFSLKCPSLLEFDQTIRKGSTPIITNMKRLFGVNHVPSDSGMRKCLDEVDPFDLRGAFKTIFAQLQRGKILERFRYINDHVLLAIDGKGCFHPSRSIVCIAVRSIIVMERRPTFITCYVLYWCIRSKRSSFLWCPRRLSKAMEQQKTILSAMLASDSWTIFGENIPI